MLHFPDIDPEIFSIGPLHFRWYGLMYVLGFIGAYILVVYQANKFQWQKLRIYVDSLNMHLVIGVILGGRLGYILLYNLPYYLDNPVHILAVWEGGMSFHGGCLGVLIAGALFCWRQKLAFWKAADLYVATVPIGLFFGRLGNFINGELYGKTTDMPWAMIFPHGGPLPRHPSQLYEAFLEGLVLFCILWSLKGKPWRQEQPKPPWVHGAILSLFLIGYGTARFLVEIFREPDPQLGLIFQGLSMGQILSVIMVCMGIGLWLILVRRTIT
ncbi:MAG: prolipoprotein diacylglyceryl transferase [Desulfobulbus propionicus]|nr:MAG: prolipoprotein diacylglyceryl transferase [Desulfobulbus propionicus]